jgi:hypothetical protein
MLLSIHVRAVGRSGSLSVLRSHRTTYFNPVSSGTTMDGARAGMLPRSDMMQSVKDAERRNT